MASAVFMVRSPALDIMVFAIFKRLESTITAEKVRILVETYANPTDVGTFVKVNKTSVSGNEEGENHGIVVFECEFTEKKVGVGVSFDVNMQLTGITLARS